MKVTHEPTIDRLLNAREASELLSVSTRHLWALASRGEVKPVRLGRRCTRWRMTDLLVYIEKLSAEAGGAR